MRPETSGATFVPAAWSTTTSFSSSVYCVSSSSLVNKTRYFPPISRRLDISTQSVLFRPSEMAMP